MKYNIQIMSQEEALDFYETYKDNDKYLLISISDKEGDLTFEPKDNIIDHQSYFADIEKETGISGIKLMDLKQANEIKSSVCKAVNEDISNIIVHCYAGISRSGAVGCVIAKYLNDDDIYLWKQGGIAPNKLVYKLMSQAFELKYSDKEFEYRQRISKRILDRRFSDYGININDMFPYDN